LEYFDGLATTADLIASWNVSRPCLAKARGSIFDDAFGPERSGEKVDWTLLTLKASANGVYVADLAHVFGGEKRVAYMKAALHSVKGQEVLFGTGSDDAIKVWLNGIFQLTRSDYHARLSVALWRAVSVAAAPEVALDASGRAATDSASIPTSANTTS